MVHAIGALDVAAWLLWLAVLLLAASSLALIIVGDRTSRAVLLFSAVGALILDLALAAVARSTAPPLIGLPLVVVGLTLAVLGGSGLTRTVLTMSGGAPDTGTHGGIVPAGVDGQEVLRGGRTIGYLERAATAAAIVAGFPEAIAVVVAIKGVGRFTELGEAETRERFIIGTLTSLLWASLVAGMVRLAIS